MPTFTPDTYGVKINSETQGGEGERFSLWRHYGLPIQTSYVVIITDGVATAAPGRKSPNYMTDIVGNAEVDNAVASYDGADSGSGDDGRAVFQGGITYNVTSAEETILEAAGYTVADDVTFTYPTNFDTVAEPVTITGEASNVNGVSTVEINVYSRDTEEYWDGSAWGVTRVWIPVTLSEANVVNPTWSYVFDSSTGTTVQDYWVPARAYDVNGALGGQYSLNFGVT